MWLIHAGLVCVWEAEKRNKKLVIAFSTGFTDWLGGLKCFLPQCVSHTVHGRTRKNESTWNREKQLVKVVRSGNSNAHTQQHHTAICTLRDKFSKVFFLLPEKVCRREKNCKSYFVSLFSGLCARKRYTRRVCVCVGHLAAVHFFFSFFREFLSFSFSHIDTHTGVFYCGTVAKRRVKYEFNWLEWMSFRSGLPLSSFFFVTVVAACKPVDKI